MTKLSVPSPDEVRAAAAAWMVALEGLPAEPGRRDRGVRLRVEGALLGAPAAVEVLTRGCA